MRKRSPEVSGMVVDFLNGLEGFESELQRRLGISAQSEASLDRELESLGRQQREEQEAESRAFRPAARGNVSEEVFNQEIGLIHTRQRWLAEQEERLEQQLADIQRCSFDPQSIKTLRQWLEEKLATATPEDRRFILEAVGAKVLVQADGTWELELQIPREIPSLQKGLQTSFQVIASVCGLGLSQVLGQVESRPIRDGVTCRRRTA